MESVKAQKLAAARKMLKQYQQKTQHAKPNVKGGDDLKSAHADQVKFVVEDDTRSASPISSIAAEEKVEQVISTRISEAHSTPEILPNVTHQETYFNNSLFQDNVNVETNYFDNIASFKPSDCSVNDSAIAASLAQSLEYSFQMKPVSQELIGVLHMPNETHEESTCREPEIVESAEVAESTEIAENAEITENAEIAESALGNNIMNEYVSQNYESTYSNAESLRQLSSQINSVIEKEFDTSPSEISQLERRNQELAASLDNEKLKNDKLNLQMREYLSRITQLQLELQQTQNEFEIKLDKELGPLQEQLQYHIQTVGILVGEKTELTMSLNQSQQTAKQKTSECEELQGRLKASRHRVSDLEKELNMLKSASSSFDANNKTNTQEFDKLKTEIQSLKEQLEEVTEESNELKEKLNVKTNENMNLLRELQDKNSQLSLVQLRVQQLSSVEDMQTQSELELLNKQKISLEQQIADLTQTVKTMSAERNQANQQYQQYVQQLNAQLQSLAEKLETVSNENESLTNHEQSLLKHVGELEKRLQQVQSEQQNITVVASDNSEEVAKLESELDSLRSRYSELENLHEAGQNNVEVLKKQVMDMDYKIQELEGIIERLQSDQPDAGKLLATIESDKVAASRAIEQNNKLKDQIEELHEAFVQMSNSKLELTENWESEKHRAQELAYRVEQLESELEKLLTTISCKDKELTEMQTMSDNYEKQTLQYNQLIDRMRHYEASGNVSDIIQQELKSANEEIERLTIENERKNSSSIHEHDTQKVLTEGEEMKMQDVIVQTDLQDLMAQIEVADDGSSETYLKKEVAMHQLEDRFTRTMAEIADLSDEKQRLEHLVLQLQSETETIGEYVALYQCQRALLKQKTLEKDEQLKRLSHDREEMKFKLEELNGLVRQLMHEKDVSFTEVCSEINEKHIHTNHECNNIESPSETHTNDSINNNEVDGQNVDTTKKIMALITEIKSSNLVQPVEGAHNFHPCPWCSGQLITV